MNATDPQTAPGAAERVTAWLAGWDAEPYMAGETIVCGSFGNSPRLDIADLRALLAERDQLAASATVEWGLNVPAYYLPGHKDHVTPYRDEASVREHAAIARRSGDTANIFRRNIGPWELVDTAEETTT